MNLEKINPKIFMYEFKKHKIRQIDYAWDKTPPFDKNFNILSEKRRELFIEFTKIYAFIDSENYIKEINRTDRKLIINCCAMYAEENNLIDINFEYFYNQIIEYIKLKILIDKI